ncbi:MAG: helix-turn-helix transcriptional regulator [Solobacterium sp.]|nr:helix-turn-helix transcriptional regulator [Solobacterium sp.]
MKEKEYKNYTIKALAYMKNMTIDELAKAINTEPQRLYDVSSGRSELLGRELLKIAQFVDVNPFDIKT